VVDFYKHLKGFLILLVALTLPSIKFSKDKRSYDKKVHVKGITGKRSRLLERLTVRQRPGVATFRFWQEGPGYDRNLTKSIASAENGQRNRLEA
jgi:hypothetical protein